MQIDRTQFQVGKKIRATHWGRVNGVPTPRHHDGVISEVKDDRCFYTTEHSTIPGGFSFEALERGLVQVAFHAPA